MRNSNVCYFTSPVPNLVTLKFQMTHISFITDCTSNLDVCFVLDASGSIGDENFRKIKDFIGTVVDDMDVESRQVRVAATTFETKYVSDSSQDVENFYGSIVSNGLLHYLCYLNLSFLWEV